ncbi:hypothetical protein TSAR_001298 [Trichomalopsis sarcophagae]|uniref:Uncharacterized protein n=1 Tax=Trichomalopsis sarcophagae TaxID=543379 RepID=A0A232EHL6_9HYME|nr:hypothetical protein TSAR_001298 [Trichomalopsis sarcophagae]
MPNCTRTVPNCARTVPNCARLCQSGPHYVLHIYQSEHLAIAWHTDELLRKTVLDEVFEVSNTPAYVTDPTQAADVMEPAEDEDIIVLKKGVKFKM